MTAEQIAQNIAFTFFTATETFKPMSAAEQREAFGAVVFGRKAIRWNARTRSIQTRVTTISRDYDVQSYTLAEVAELVNKGAKATRGYTGYKKH